MVMANRSVDMEWDEMAEDRSRLRLTFNEDALLYDRARPGYPEELFDDLVALSGLPSGGRVLEIGCGTGQATLPMARRGFSILCVELGASLVAVARRNLAVFPGVEIVNADFEAWPVQEGAFDLVTAATALHWIDPSVRYHKIARALRPGGAVAPFQHSHVQTDKEQGFFEEVQRVYERVAPEIVDPAFTGLPRPEEVPAPEAERIEETGRYGPVSVRRYPFAVEYDSGSYARLLNTYSGHRGLAPRVRERLLGAIADLIDSKYGGSIIKGYLVTLCVAHRL